MTISEALRRGVRTLNGSKRLLLVFYLGATVPSALVAGAAMAILWDSLGHSAWAEQMAGNFDLQWISEMIAGGGVLPIWPLAVTLAGAFAIAEIVNLFLLGGAVQLFRSRDSFTMQAFFAGCGRNFWRFVRLALVSAIFYGVALGIGRLLASAGEAIWGEGSAGAPLIYWGWFRIAAVVLLLGYINLVFAWGRIHIVAEDGGKAFRAAFAAFAFVGRNFRQTAALYLTACGMALVCMAVYFALSTALSVPAWWAIAILFLARQGVVLVRIWAMLLLYSSGMELYDALKPARKSEPLPPSEPAPAGLEEAGEPRLALDHFPE